MIKKINKENKKFRSIKEAAKVGGFCVWLGYWSDKLTCKRKKIKNNSWNQSHKFERPLPRKVHPEGLTRN